MANPIGVVALRRSIAALADPARAAGVRRAVPGARTNGASVPRLRALARTLPKARDTAGFERACALMDALCRSGSREDFLVGSFLVGRHQRAVRDLTWTRVSRWLAAVDNWETCDQLAAEILATLVDAQPALGAKLKALTRSADMWQRRIAVATAASLNQRGRSQPAITRIVCDLLEDDPEPMIRKAVGWARRELAKRDRT